MTLTLKNFSAIPTSRPKCRVITSREMDADEQRIRTDNGRPAERTIGKNNASAVYYNTVGGSTTIDCQVQVYSLRVYIMLLENSYLCQCCNTPYSKCYTPLEICMLNR